MTLPNKSNNYDKEVRQESYTDGNGNIYQTKQTTEKVEQNPNNGSYTHGYVHGQAAERSYHKRIVQRDEENASRGLLLGILIATIAILAGGFIWYINQRDNYESNPVTPIIIPNTDKPQDNPSPSPSIEPQTRQESNSQTTIIEKVREVPIPVPVPQEQPSQPQQSTPEQQPSAKQVEPSQPQNQINILPTTPDTSNSANQTSQPDSSPSEPESQTNSSSKENPAE